MTLMRGFAKVDEEGKVKIPDNVRLAAGLKAGQLVELKVAGAGASVAKNIMLSKKKDYR